MGSMADPTPEQVERGTGALIPFVQAGGLQLNPEDLAEIAFAVLKHYDSTESWEAIHGAVKVQIAEHPQHAAELDAAYRARRAPES